MGLFSASKNKEEAASADGEFYSRAEDDTQLAGGATRKPRKSSKSKSNAPIDPVLPEKKRARRRLIGAVALVLAMIIGLPMLLDSEPKPISDDIAVQIPSKDKPGALPVATSTAASASTSPSASNSASSSAAVPLAASLGQQEQIVNLPPASGSNSKPPVPNVATPARMPAPATPAVTTSVPASSTVPAVAPTTSAAASKTKSKDEAKPENKPEAKPEVKVADAKPAKLEHDDARAEAILEGKDDAKANADKKSGKFIVQVAALASQEKVDELQGKLNEAGIKSYVQKVATDSGERVMRVRIGPFASKEEAESARAKLGKIGLNGKLLPSS